MINFLFSTFLVFSLAFNVSAEYFNGPQESEQQSSISNDMYYGSNSIVSYKHSHGCENCESDGCHHESGHCSHHCSGLHNIIAGESISYDEPARIVKKSNFNWTYANHYKNPYLDSRIIPPNFS